MRVLFIVPYAPTLIRTRPYHLIRYLARRGHTVTLATLCETDAEWKALAILAGEGVTVVARPLTKAQIARNALGALTGSMPLQARYCWHPALAQAIAERIGHSDLVHVEHLRGAEYGRRISQLLHQRRQPTPVVWDSVDCISLLFEQAARLSRSRFGRWMTRFELPRTRRYEAAMVRQFDAVLATSPRDQAALEALARSHDGGCWSTGKLEEHARVTVLPNGVDSDYFAPPRVRPASNQVILTGKMSYHANVTAALHLVQEIMPRVWERRPTTEVVIAGSTPPTAVRDLALRYAPRVTVTGYVPDLRPYLHAAAVAVAPVAYGAGIQNKALEAMACGLPVVASPQASSALQARPGRDLLVAHTPRDFTEAILRLLKAPVLRHQIGRAGRDYVVAHHSWDEIAARLEGVYHECMAMALS